MGPGKMAEVKLRRYRNYIYHLNKSIAAFPNYTGICYRGVGVRFPEALYETGKMVTWQQFSSASKSELVSMTFLINSDGALCGSMFILNVASSKAIEDVSDYPAEQEVLLNFNSHFVVEEKVSDDGQKHHLLPQLEKYDLTSLDVIRLQEP